MCKSTELKNRLYNDQLASSSYVLGMSVDPAKSEYVVLDLTFEELHFICHIAVVRVAFLLRDYQVGHNEVPLLLFAGKDRARLDLVRCVSACACDEVLY